MTKYLEISHMPTIWCSGCGNGIVMNTMLRAFEEEALTPDNTVIVSGIGCSSRMPGYLTFPSVHTAHGRAIPFATGLKMARPDLNIVIVSGDGDAAAIGGNHLIHACRRNLDLTLIIINNETYGMTNGQFSPLTPIGSFSSTSEYGSIDRPFDVMKLCAAAGATYAARSSVYHTEQLKRFISEGTRNHGFSVIECLSICPTHYGKDNGFSDPVEMMNFLRDNCTWMGKDGKRKKYCMDLGVFCGESAPEYSDEYAKMRDRVRLL